MALTLDHMYMCMNCDLNALLIVYSITSNLLDLYDMCVYFKHYLNNDECVHTFPLSPFAQSDEYICMHHISLSWKPN